MLLQDGDEVFTPMGQPMRVRLVRVLRDGTVRYKVNGDPDWRYLWHNKANPRRNTVTVRRGADTR